MIPQMANGLNVVFFFQRKPGYYIINVIFPSFAIIVLGLLVFLIPEQSGEKISFGMADFSGFLGIFAASWISFATIIREHSIHWLVGILLFFLMKESINRSNVENVQNRYFGF